MKPEGSSQHEFENAVLRHLALGQHDREIEIELGLMPHSLRKTILPNLRKKFGLTTRGLAGWYGNSVGLQGISVRDPQMLNDDETFRFGRINCSALCVISSAVKRQQDVICSISTDPYVAPPEFQHDLEHLQQRAAARLSQQGIRNYEAPGDVTPVVHALRSETEFFSPLEFELRRTGYYTYRAVLDNLTPELRVKYRVKPRMVTSAVLPLPMGVGLFLTATRTGSDSKCWLVVNRRGQDLGHYPGVYGVTIGGLGEADKDRFIRNGKLYFDWVGAMTREFKDERRLGLQKFRDDVKPVAVVYEYSLMHFSIFGHIDLVGVDPGLVRDAISKAKEGTYELVRFPKDRDDNEGLHAICQHLLNSPWQEASTASLIVLLEEICGATKVYSELS